MTSCASTDPDLRCSKGRRCQACMERDALVKSEAKKMTAEILRTAAELPDELRLHARRRFCS